MTIGPSRASASAPSAVHHQPANILVVDEDAVFADAMRGPLQSRGHRVTTAGSAGRAIEYLKAGRYDLVIAERNMAGPGGDGLLHFTRGACPEVPVIVTAGHGVVACAVEAMKRGACDFLVKPISEEVLLASVDSALLRRQSQDEGRRRSPAGRGGLSGIVGQDFRMVKVFDVVEAVSSTRTTVLITGESGTGKSLIARAIHSHSTRAAGPFVEVSCGALPETLLESELFGHVRGAFTGATADKQGKFAAAAGGTIFLDEISTASPALQVKLLRVLQERQFEPVGSNQTCEVDVRVILATNHDLTQEVAAGRFRSDLFYRINVVNIELPPLRDRPSDIPALAEHFLGKYDEAGRIGQGIQGDAIAAMLRYTWPGNIRELENFIERAVVLSRTASIGPEDLPPAVRTQGPTQNPEATSTSLYDALCGPERQIILNTLNSNNGSRQLTAAQLGINRCTLYKKMKKFGLLGEV